MTSSLKSGPKRSYHSAGAASNRGGHPRSSAVATSSKTSGKKRRKTGRSSRSSSEHTQTTDPSALKDDSGVRKRDGSDERQVQAIDGAAVVPFDVHFSRRPIGFKRQTPSSGLRKPPETEPGYRYEASPFDARLDVAFKVVRTRTDGTTDTDEAHGWGSMRSIDSIHINGETYAVGDVIYVSHEGETTKHGIRDWVAKVLECRCISGSNFIFARIVWLYRPEDLPEGRKEWHSASEVIATNDMQIISATSINGIVKLHHWNEARLLKEGEQTYEHPQYPDEDIFWRTIYNSIANKLSRPHYFCVCRRPDNPDGVAVFCPLRDGCGLIMHEQCLLDHAIKQAYRTYCGRSDSSRARPTPTGAASHAQHGITHSSASGQPSSISSPSGRKSRSVPLANRRPKTLSPGRVTRSGALVNGPPVSARPQTKNPSGSKSSARSHDPTRKPRVTIAAARKAFSAELREPQDKEIQTALSALARRDAGKDPSTFYCTIIRITDLRSTGEGASWEEPARCLRCGRSV